MEEFQSAESLISDSMIIEYDEIVDRSTQLNLITDDGEEESKASKSGNNTKEKTPKASKVVTMRLAKQEIEGELKSVLITAIHPKLLNKSVCLEINIEGLGEIPLHSKDESWRELLLLLLGSIYNENPDNFEKVLGGYGILGDGIRIEKEIKLRLDNEIEDNFSIYKLPYSDYKIEIRGLNESLLEGIKRSLRALHVSLKDVRLHLIPIGYEPGEEVCLGSIGTNIHTKKTNSKRVQAKKKQEQTEHQNNTEVDFGLSKLKRVVNQYTLFDLLLNQSISLSSVVSIEVLGEQMEVRGIQQAAIMVISFLAALEPNIQNILKQHTITDIVGVTEDNQDYLGIMKVTKIPNTGLYFYTNGDNRKLLEYINILITNSDITSEEIRIGLMELEVENGNG